MNPGSLFALIITSVMMVFSGIGCVCAIRDESKGLGKEWMNGIKSAGPLFLAMGAIMSAVPLLAIVVKWTLRYLFVYTHSNAATAGSCIIGVDMGGNNLADELSFEDVKWGTVDEGYQVEAWYTATIAAYSIGATVSYVIPTGVILTEESDQKYVAVGIMCGFITVPVQLILTYICMHYTQPIVSSEFGSGKLDYTLHIDLSQACSSTIPIIIIILLFAPVLFLRPRWVVSGFTSLSKFIDAFIKIVFFIGCMSILTGAVEYVPVLKSLFDPMIADKEDLMRGEKPLSMYAVYIDEIYAECRLYGRFIEAYVHISSL
jgi:ethanolamine transporter